MVLLFLSIDSVMQNLVTTFHQWLWVERMCNVCYLSISNTDLAQDTSQHTLLLQITAMLFSCFEKILVRQIVTVKGSQSYTLFLAWEEEEGPIFLAGVVCNFSGDR